jgi:hypothetical protein
MAEIFELLSVSPEGNVFESVDARGECPPHHRIESICGCSYGRRARACILGDSGRRRIRHTDMRRLRRREAQSSPCQ